MNSASQFAYHDHRVLIIDDNQDFAESLRYILEFQHYEVAVAGSAPAALQQLKDFSAAVALIDINLGNSSGIDLIPLLKQQRPELLCVIMTAYASTDTAIDALHAGAHSYLCKPFHPNELLAVLNRCFAQIRLEWENAAALKALRESEKRFRILYDDAPVMFFTLDPHGDIISANYFAAQQLGFEANELKGMPASAFYDEKGKLSLQRHTQDCLANPAVVQCWENYKVRRDGSLFRAKETARLIEGGNGEPTILIVCEDITEAHKLSKQLTYQASHDPLTGLINRREFERRLQRVLRTAYANKTEHALCYLDLDRFKFVNDTCGHTAGDELLRQLGNLLRSQIRKRDTLARLGGDEFAVLLEHCSLDHARQITAKVHRAIEGFRFLWENKCFKVGSSIGLVSITEAMGTVTEVLNVADNACYEAKSRGRNRVHVHLGEPLEPVNDNQENQQINELQRAFAKDRFLLYKQPILALAEQNDRQHYYELLVRMEDRQQRIIMPGAFLPVAERYRLSPKLDRWVINTAFKWFADHRQDLEQFTLCFINLSAQSLTDEAFIKFVIEQFSQRQIPPNKICFEMAETAAIANLTHVQNFISELRTLGCHFALDEFSCGLSSVAYLKNLPVDFLKIDRVLIKNIVRDPVDQALVKAINEIGRVMKIKTVAGFVEDDATLATLRKIGVDFVQGYAIGRPQPLEENNCRHC